MFKLVLEKAKETRDQITNIHWIIRKARELQKNIYFCLIDYAKAFECVYHNELEKISFHSNIKGNAKECSNYNRIALISHAIKVMLKIPQARLQQYVNCEIPDVQAGFRKGRGTRDQIANIHWIM